MKQEVYTIGDSVEMLCPACDTDQDHTIEAATKHGRITKATCQVCATSSTFSRGVKTSVAMSGSRTATPYDRTRKYRKGQAMMHAKFGQGEVMAVVDPQKIDVLFGDQTRRLLHAQILM